MKWLLLVSLSFVACNDDDAVAELPVTSGSADFSNYVALGDSFAAGFSDGALFKKGQENSYPAILAKQFKQAGGGDFTTPFCGDDNLGGLLFGGTPIQGTRVAILGMYPNGTPNIGSIPGTPVTEVTNVQVGPFNNMGVPGAKSYHLSAAGYGNLAGVPGGMASPYFARFATSSSTSILSDALVQNPTFFSLWIGGNDVLGYATTGGDGSNPITPAATFSAAYNDLATQLSAGGRKGVVANLPYLNTLPHFTVISVKPVNPSAYFTDGDENNASPVVSAGDLATISALNTQLYGPLKQALTAFGAGDRLELLSTTSANPLLIKDETLPNLSAQLTAAFTPTLGPATAAFYGNVFGQARQTKKMPDGSTDYVLLSTKSSIGAAPTAANSGLGFAPPAPLNKFGITYPLQDKFILIPSEISEIKAATDEYNEIIQAAATANNLAFVDAKTVMNQLLNGGIRFGNYHVSASFVVGGVFSLDGIHPTARGYALVANKFIQAINAKYGSTVKQADLGLYQIQYPGSL